LDLNAGSEKNHQGAEEFENKPTKYLETKTKPMEKKT
jgi:hypothetical protein